MKKKMENLFKIGLLQVVIGLLIGVIFGSSDGGMYMIGAGITMFLYSWFWRKR